jgi:DnaJ-domain-containing protein 1
MNAAQPKVTGTLGKTPLLHVLTSLMEQAETGTLVLETTSGERSAISVDRGLPLKMRLGQSALYLGDILVELGWIRREIANSSYEKAVSLGLLHGRVLVDDGHIEAEILEPALRTQLVKKLQVAAALPPDTAFGFYEGVDYLSKWRGGKTAVAPLVALWALARSRAEPAIIATVLSRVAARPLRLHPNAQLRSFGFDRTEMTLLDVLRAKPQTMEGLAKMGLVSPLVLERMVYVLTLTRHLDFGRGLAPLGVGMVSEREESLLLPKDTRRISRPVVVAAAHPAVPIAQQSPPAGTDRIGSDIAGAVQRLTPAPGRGSLGGEPPVGCDGDRRSNSALPLGSQAKPTVTSSLALSERRAQIEDIAARITQLDLFEVLGLPRDATIAAVQEAYLHQAKAYHPDRLPPEMLDLKPQATKIFARMGEAHQTLSDAGKRTQYLEHLNQGTAVDSEEESIRKILHAAGAFQKAEVLLKKRMLAAAELEVNRALEGDPEQADYLALYAWIQACKADSEARLPELCKLLTTAIERNPSSEKNRFYRVQIYKRLGQVDKAVSDCRIIVEKNPHHVDALREIRLWEMRRVAQKQNTPGALRGTGTRSPSEPPNHPAPAAKDSDAPAPSGGLFGRFFKR